MLSLVMSIQDTIYYQRSEQILRAMRANCFKYVNELADIHMSAPNPTTKHSIQIERQMEIARELFKRYLSCLKQIKASHPARQWSFWPFSGPKPMSSLLELEDRAAEIDLCLQAGLAICRKKISHYYRQTLKRRHSMIW